MRELRTHKKSYGPCVSQCDVSKQSLTLDALRRARMTSEGDNWSISETQHSTDVTSSRGEEGRTSDWKLQLPGCVVLPYRRYGGAVGAGF